VPVTTILAGRWRSSRGFSTTRIGVACTEYLDKGSQKRSAMTGEYILPAGNSDGDEVAPSRWSTVRVWTRRVSESDRESECIIFRSADVIIDFSRDYVSFNASFRSAHRLNENRIANQAFEMVTNIWKYRKRGRPKKNWKSTVIEDLKKMKMDWNTEVKRTQDRRAWHGSVAQCAAGARGRTKI